MGRGSNITVGGGGVREHPSEDQDPESTRTLLRNPDGCVVVADGRRVVRACACDRVQSRVHVSSLCVSACVCIENHPIASSTAGLNGI